MISMTFTSEAKKECARLAIKNECCILSEIAAFVRLNGVLELGGLKDTMVLSILAWSNDLDDMGYPHDLGNHMYTV